MPNFQVKTWRQRQTETLWLGAYECSWPLGCGASQGAALLAQTCACEHRWVFTAEGYFLRGTGARDSEPHAGPLWWLSLVSHLRVLGNGDPGWGMLLQSCMWAAQGPFQMNIYATFWGW